MTVKHNDCFPCHHYRNHNDEYVYCNKERELNEEAGPVFFWHFGKPHKCPHWSPEEAGTDYYVHKEELINSVKAAVEKYNSRG